MGRKRHPGGHPGTRCSSAQRRLHVFFSGSVQGVGFRYTTFSIAQDYPLTGWVRNVMDGRVELLVEGDPAQIEAFMRALEEAMSGYISGVERAWEAPTGEFTGFKIDATY